MSKDKNSKPSFFSIMLSAMAAAFGVQSRRIHERDFQHKSIWPFIAAGVIFTAMFLGALILIVSLVLAP